MNAETLKSDLSKIIDRHRGRQNPITRRELWGILDIQNMSQDRKMRQTITELRREGLPVLFATSKNPGYYLPNTLAEVEEGKRQRRSYIIDECITLAALKTYGARFVQKEEQIILL